MSQNGAIAKTARTKTSQFVINSKGIIKCMQQTGLRISLLKCSFLRDSFVLLAIKNKLHCLVFYKQLQNDHGFYYMFMQTRLSGTERITAVNKDLNNVNITAGCLAADNATFIYRFLTFARLQSLQPCKVTFAILMDFLFSLAKDLTVILIPVEVVSPKTGNKFTVCFI